MRLALVAFVCLLSGGGTSQAQTTTATSGCGTFMYDNECAPPPNTPGVVVSDKMREHLYARCEGLKKEYTDKKISNPFDGYTKQCCDHLTDGLARTKKVCTHAPKKKKSISINSSNK